MQAELASAALEQDAGRLHRQRRHRIGLAAPRIERARAGQTRDAHFPLHLGVIGFQFGIGDGPVHQARPRDGPQPAALDEVDLVQTPEVGVEMRAAAPNDTRIGQRVSPRGAFGLLVWGTPERLRIGGRVVGDPGEVAVLQLVVLEIAGRHARALLHDDDAVSGAGEFPRHDAAGRAGADDDEIDRLAWQVCLAVHVHRSGSLRRCGAACRDRA